MKARRDISYQQKKENREKLEKVIPMKTPLSMQIELASACNFKCKFCMHGNDNLLKEGKYTSGIMKYDIFTKIVDDLTLFPNKLKFISLQSRGESFLNPRIADMIKYIKKKKVAHEIAINTNASLLSSNLNLAIIDAGLDVIRISIEGVSREKYKEVAGVNIDFDQMVNNITHLYGHKKNCHMYIKTIDCNMSEAEKEKFYDIFGNICDSISIENPVNAWDGAGLDDAIFKESRYNTRVSHCVVCPRIFFAYVVHYDGTVVACDHDWSEQYPIGHVLENSLVAIWENAQMNKLRRIHLEKRGHEIVRCQNCINLKSNFLDNIDDFAHELIKYY